MRLNAANRAFTAIVVIAGAVFGLFAGTACWVFAMVLYRLVNDGLTTLGDGGTIAGLVLIALLVAASVLASGGRQCYVPTHGGCRACPVWEEAA